jgi:hypothetical protein
MGEILEFKGRGSGKNTLPKKEEQGNSKGAGKPADLLEARENKNLRIEFENIKTRAQKLKDSFYAGESKPGEYAREYSELMDSISDFQKRVSKRIEDFSDRQARNADPSGINMPIADIEKSDPEYFVEIMEAEETIDSLWGMRTEADEISKEIEESFLGA